MQGSIAQVVALTTYGNACLNGAPDSRNLNFYPSSSTFTFCEIVKFVDLRQDGEKPEEIPYEPDPVAWFERLQNNGVTSLRMIYGPSGEKRFPDRQLVGFVGGGGRWLIETIGTGSSDHWEGRWQLGDRDRKDRKIWRVAYGRIGVGQPSSCKQIEDIGDLREGLRCCLEAIAEFARSQKLEEFAKAFESGLSRLSWESPLNELYHQDIAPSQALSLPARQLLGAAQAAWVFGGMGSWNDVGFQGGNQTRYEELSEQLYQLLNRAIVAAANSSIRSERQKKRWWFLN
jgi:hypothetical protein